MEYQKAGSISGLSEYKNKFERSFFGRSYGSTILFWELLTFSTIFRENSFCEFLNFWQKFKQKWLYLSLTQTKFWVMWFSLFYRKIRPLSVFPLVQRAFLFFVVASCRRTLLLARPAGFFKTLKSTHFLPSLRKTFKIDKSWAYL